MKIGLQIPSFSWPGSPNSLGRTFAEIGRSADDAGFASLWVMDHFFQIPLVGPAEQEMLEAYTALGFLAGVTRRAKLGTMVTGVTYRQPGLLAKTVTTLDVLSGGRAYLGIGAAWFEREHAGLGVAFPPLAERFERLEEALRICKQMFSQDTGPYEGRHYRLAETLNSPPPISQPHPPILIGGLGEKKTLRLVARYADACNLFAFIGEDPLRHKLDVLRRHCDAEKRDYDEIEKTALTVVQLAPGKSSVGKAIADLRALGDLGFEHVILSMPNVHEIEPIEIFGREIIPALAAS